MRTIGILGGMGPEATALFYRQVVQLTPALEDQQHFRTLILSDPSIPDRTAHLIEGGPSPLPQLLAGVRQLEDLGVDLIAVPCNTAHAYWAQMQEAVRVPVLNILQETCRRVARELEEGPVGLLATTGTLRTRLYQQALEDVSHSCLVPDPELQEKVQRGIRRIKTGQVSEALADIQQAVEQLKSRGARAIILGCTELTLVGDRIAAKIPCFDSSRILAAATVARALGEEAISRREGKDG